MGFKRDLATVLAVDFEMDMTKGSRDRMALEALITKKYKSLKALKNLVGGKSEC